MTADPESWLQALPASPRDRGRVVRCVLRPRPGARELAPLLQVDPQRGVAGDRRRPARPGAVQRQVSLINAHVLASFAGPDLERAAPSGGSLVVGRDLSLANLPPATRLALAAMARGLRGRGVLCSFVRAGTIRAGDPLDVRRP